MYDQSFDIGVIRQRNEEMLREVRASRLGGRSRADQAPRFGARRVLQALVGKGRTALLGEVAPVDRV